ncbi:MAG: hypothetical protein FJZ96_12205 [Chloroflexi bacterium]|nr:hypothetical protein [Chloroflexota bacterium]
MVRVSVAVEGPLDEAVINRLAQLTEIEIGTVYGKEGKNALRSKINGYNHAAKFSPWVVLVDLNHEYECAPLLLASWLPRPTPYMCLRVAVKKIESWFLADRTNIAAFLGVSASLLPRSPDLEEDAKRTLVNLARRSRYLSIRRDLVPTQSSGRQVGPAYTSRMADFVNKIWDPSRATEESPSLSKCIAALDQISLI